MISLITGILAGGAVVFVLMRTARKALEVKNALLQEDRLGWQAKEQQMALEKTEMLKENVRLKESLNHLEERLEYQKKEFGDARQVLTDQFRNLANEILEDKSRRFTETNRGNMEGILHPLNKELEEFRKMVDEAYHKESTERTVLERKITELVQLNNQIRLEAVNLTNALKGNTKVQGDWGEMILERILENSGLTKGREYFVQETLKNESGEVLYNGTGNRMRPDVIVVYPGNRKVIVDSKVSLTAYVNYCNANDDAERGLALKAHLQSVRRHIEELARKDYSGWAGGTPDFVMMFVPNEASYLLAMQTEPTLWSEAYRQGVLLLSPANLIVALKLAADLWCREYQSRNVMEIAERGAKLYDKCLAFLESFTAIGEQIHKTQETYDQAYKKLKSGNGNLIAQTQKLKELGIQSKKKSKDLL